MMKWDELHALRNAWRLAGPDWNRRIQAAKLLGEERALEAIPDLEAVALENKQPDLAKAAIRALGQICDETAFVAVARVVKGSPDEILATQCLDVLLLGMKNGSRTAVQALIEQCDRFFPVLLNRVMQSDEVARQGILQMGEQGIHKLMDALLVPETREVAGSMLRELG